MTPQVWALEKADEIMDSLADCENHGPTKLRVIAAALEEAVKAEREACALLAPTSNSASAIRLRGKVKQLYIRWDGL